MRSAWAVAFSLSLAVCPTRVRAEAAADPAEDLAVSADRDAAARAEFELGVSELRAEKWSDAERSFRRSLSAVPRASTLYDLAFVLLKQGRLRASIEAVHALERATELPDRERYREPAAALERWATSGLSVISIVASPARARVLVDGQKTEPDGNSSRAKVDPGLHRVEVGAEGFATQVSSVTTTYGAVVEKRVVLAPLSSGKAAPAGSTMSPWPWVTAGVGGAVLIAGIVTGILAKQADDELTASCPEIHGCDPSLADKKDHVMTLGTVADVLLVSGGVVAAGGVTWGIVDAFSAAPTQNGFFVTARARF